MTFKHRFLSTAAAGSILLGASAIDPAVFSVITKAEAATNISIDINVGTFYDRLEPYGNWVSYQDDYVWIPQHVDREWRPYTRGHWAYTRRYGWLWVSNERFGWATYHYGRWGYSHDIGWYWVPGHRWAPAWVAWHRGDREVAWAPLPPRHGNDLDVSITIGDVPDYYWQAVPVSAFLSFDLSGHVIRDRDHVRTIVQQGTPETVRIENNIVINNVIEVNYIEKETKSKVKVFEEKAVNNPDAVGKTDTNSVAIFNPDVKDAADAKPKKTRKVEEVATERKAKGIPPQDQPADQTGAPAVGADTTAQPAVKAGQPDASSTKTSVPAPILKQDKAANTQQTDTGNATTNVPTGKPKLDKSINKIAPQDVQQNADQQNNGQQNSDQQNGVQKKSKKKKNASPSDQQGTNKNATVPADQQTPPTNGKHKKKVEQPATNDKKVKPECDPAVEVCPPPAQ